MSEITTQKKPISIGFLLVPNFTMMAFTSAVEPLRMANRLLDKKEYHWHIITQDGQPCSASNGITITADCSLENAPSMNYLFLVGGTNIKENISKSLTNSLMKFSHKKMVLGGICTGTYLIAKAGLLDGYRAAIHWENIASTREELPNVTIIEELYSMDRDRITCAGGVGAMDMMLNLIAQQHSNSFAASISEQFLLPRIRDRQDQQRTPLHLKLGYCQPKLTEAVMLMEANIEEPISLEELSALVGLSRRQLERLFQKYLKCVPTRYYMELRLKQARLLLLQSNKPVVDVALACGFVSATHFSKCYRDFFGIPPSEARRQTSRTT